MRLREESESMGSKMIEGCVCGKKREEHQLGERGKGVSENKEE